MVYLLWFLILTFCGSGDATLIEVQAMALVKELLAWCLAGLRISQHKQINSINGLNIFRQYLLFDITHILDA
jgi:hypothetical protein